MLGRLALLACLFLAACGDDPGLIEVTPPEHDFGRVMQGQQPEFTFTVTNHSDRSVGLKAMPNCSCFAAALGLGRLDPGQSQELHVMFDTTKIMGVVQGKWVTLHTDHPQLPGIIIPLKGEIFRAYELDPPRLDLGRFDGRPENYEPRVIHVRPESGYTVQLERAVAMPQVLSFEPVPTPSGGVDVRVSIPRDVRRPLGAFRVAIRLELALTAPSGKVMRHGATVPLEAMWILKP